MLKYELLFQNGIHYHIIVLILIKALTLGFCKQGLVHATLAMALLPSVYCIQLGIGMDMPYPCGSRIMADTDTDRRLCIHGVSVPLPIYNRILTGCHRIPY